MITLDPSALGPCRGVDPDNGPRSLPFKWRVLYESVDLLDMTPATRVIQSDPEGPRYRRISERELLGKMSDALGIPIARRHVTYDEWLAAIDPAIRSKLRDAVQELSQVQAVTWEDQQTPTDGWCIQLLAPGYVCVHLWRQQWISRLETLTAQPTWAQSLLKALLAPQTTADIVKGLVITFLTVGVTVPTTLLVSYLVTH